MLRHRVSNNPGDGGEKLGISDQPSPFFSGAWCSLGRPAGSATVTPAAPGALKAGLVLILGALSYRSAKRRRLGEVASTPARWVLEGIAIVLMFLSVLLL
jgi:hypothetical protein